MRLGDGTPISPKGMQEVRLGDGTVLWTAEEPGPDYGANITHQWTMSEGSGTSLADSRGDADATINGATWDGSSHDWFENYALSGNGTTDYVDTGVTGTVGSQVALAFTVAHPYTASNSNGLENLVTSGFDGNTAYEVRFNGLNLEFSVWDGVNSVHSVLTEPITTLSPNHPHRIVAQYGNGSMELWVDGILADSGPAPTASFTSTSRRLLFAHDDGGTINGFFGGLLDNVITFDGPLTESGIQADLELQPWPVDRSGGPEPEAPVAAVQQGWGEPVEHLSSDFQGTSLEGKWSKWGSGEGCYEVDTWNGWRCGRNSVVANGMHRIEGTVDGETSGSTSTSTFTYGRLEYRERAYCADNCSNDTYNVTPIIYPDNPASQIAGNGEMDIAERRITDQDPFFCVHWNNDNWYINVDGLNGEEWHNYAIDWQPDEISWYIDGHFVASFNLSIDIVAEHNAGQMDMMPPTGTPMHHAFYEIDWVKYYEYDADAPSPIPPNDHEGGTDWEPTGNNVRSGLGWQG